MVELGVDLAEFQAQLAQEMEAFLGIVLVLGRGGESLGHAFGTPRPLLRLVDVLFGLNSVVSWLRARSAKPCISQFEFAAAKLCSFLDSLPKAMSGATLSPKR